MVISGLKMVKSDQNEVKSGQKIGPNILEK